MTIRVALFVILSAPALLAQTRFEFQPFAGYRFGGVLRTDHQDPGAVTIGGSAVAGASFLYRLGPILSAEAMWKCQPTTATGPTGKHGVTMNEFLGNLLLDLWSVTRDQPFQAFLLAGIGGSLIGGAELGDLKYAGGLGGGIKYFVSERSGIRVQVLYAAAEVYPTSGPSAHKKQDVGQVEITVGWIWRFH